MSPSDDPYIKLLVENISLSIKAELGGLIRSEVQEAVQKEIEICIRPITDTLGEISDDGRSGSGLCGRVARLATQMDEFTRYKTFGMGIIFALTTTGALLMLGVKSWVTGLIHHVPDVTAPLPFDAKTPPQ